MKHQFKEGDGMIWKTSTKKEREKITRLLKVNGYSLYSDYIHYCNIGYNSFNNNFRFNKNKKWVTSSVKQVTNPMTFIEMERLILNKEINYEIY
jgi:hypothetical protein